MAGGSLPRPLTSPPIWRSALAAACRHLFGNPDPAAAVQVWPGDWRRDMRGAARTIRESLHEHPWMMDFIGGRPPVGPRSLRNVERTLAYFDGLGVDMRMAIDISTTVGTYVMGAVLREVQERNSETYMEQMLADLTEAEREKAIGEFTARVQATGRYPHLAELMSAGYDPDAAETRDVRFEFGLDCLLDGIAARIGSPTGDG